MQINNLDVVVMRFHRKSLWTPEMVNIYRYNHESTVCKNNLQAEVSCMGICDARNLWLQNYVRKKLRGPTRLW